ncbi:MAG: N-acetyltransferase [Actinobacteria bacterium]|jgi:acetyltransferase-like isoleucine patch superfamily enzyme|nr:N-acetyltransferase [Actinomycetota bacterium]
MVASRERVTALPVPAHPSFEVVLVSRPEPVIHPSAIVEDGAVVGDSTRVWHHAHVREGATIGRGCTLGKNVFIDAGVSIGNRVKIQNNVSVYRGVMLEDDVFVGPSAVFTNDRLPRAREEWVLTEIVVGAGASIGANATIVAGNDIGRSAMVGAGAVVTRPVAAHMVVVGNPARFVGWICRCTSTRVAPDGHGSCPDCGVSLPPAAGSSQ